MVAIRLLAGIFLALSASAAPPQEILALPSQFPDVLSGVSQELVEQNGITYELVSHPSFTEHKLRIVEPTICDPSVQQYSGYLDISEDKHLFFWIFESRTSPAEDPLVLWLNGGPGSSSMMGLLFELGPCAVTEGGNATAYNPHSWNTAANMLFLDQPADVGYSYASNTSTPVGASAVAAEDVYAFLQLFLARFGKYAALPFHIATESYGGTYAPHIATVIHKKNKDLVYAPVAGHQTINLVSIMLGNGLTDALIQLPTIAEFVCDGPLPVLDPRGLACRGLRISAPICRQMTRACYTFGDRVSCASAYVYCFSSLVTPIVKSGHNAYDVRMTCDSTEDMTACYKEMSWIVKWTSRPDVKAALGVLPEREFKMTSHEVENAFMLRGDGTRKASLLLPELVNNGLRLLVYAGNTDALGNYIGQERWLTQLPSKFHAEFAAAPPKPWYTKAGQLAGDVRSAGGHGVGAGYVTLVTVYEAGHMVPHDQPEAALDLFTRWVSDTAL